MEQGVADAKLVGLSATQAAAAIAKDEFSSQDYVGACLERIEATEPVVHAFAHIDPEYALRQAKDCDDWRQSGRPIGPLHGVPVGIKDIIDTADYPAECGSAALVGRRPKEDATLVAKLRAAGAVIIGKTVTTEFAYFTPGATRNPHDTKRTPGGSSSGTAAAVAAGMVPVAIGSQTNGSIIRPASFCGVFAMKPSHGVVSRAGVLPLSRSLDHMGPFARSIDDLALVLDVIAGYDPADPDTRPLAPRNFREVAAENFGLAPRFAFVKTAVWDKADAEAREAIEQLASDLGDNCFTYDMPDWYAPAWEAHRMVMASEMAANLGTIADKGGDKVSQRFHELMAEGRQVTAPRYLNAVALGRTLREAIDELFQQECTAILTLSTPGVAPEGTATGNPVFNSLWSLLGLPAITLPLLQGESGMPIGVQLVGAFNDDARLLRTANWLVANAG
jgi:Asp-tRNA(Asn)/Glu-tRNA(Gln) amidotransferase A subunit family amidase